MKFENARESKFLKSFPDIVFNSSSCNHPARCKFNLSYFDSSQEVSQGFNSWTKDQLVKLLEKLKEYSKQPLSYWLHQRCGGGGLTILEIYGGFPKKTEFTRPTHIPLDVRWARFRLEGDMRVVGFLIPSNLNRSKSVNSDHTFDDNTFYIVYLDQNHKFYIT